MALTPSTGTITLAALRANLDDKTAALLTQARAGAKDQMRALFIGTLTTSTPLSQRSRVWTQQDDQELRLIFGRGTADAASRTLTVALEVANGDGVFLLDRTIAVTVTSNGAGAFDTRTASSGDYRTTTGERHRLLRGVTYRLSVETDAGTWTNLSTGVQLRSLRRRA